MNRCHGQHWIRDKKRHAIYKRDGFSCTYCGAQWVRLTLDHLKPVSRGGKNGITNLVTACHTCNSRRKNMSWHEFVRTKFTEPEPIIARVKRRVRRKVDGYVK